MAADDGFRIGRHQGFDQSWQPATSREALAQHCAVFSVVGQHAFTLGLVSFFIVLLPLQRGRSTKLR